MLGNLWFWLKICLMWKNENLMYNQKKGMIKCVFVTFMHLIVFHEVVAVKGNQTFNKMKEKLFMKMPI